jgi:hypothetical protein
MTIINNDNTTSNNNTINITGERTVFKVGAVYTDSSDKRAIRNCAPMAL